MGVGSDRLIYYDRLYELVSLSQELKLGHRDARSPLVNDARAGLATLWRKKAFLREKQKRMKQMLREKQRGTSR